MSSTSSPTHTHGLHVVIPITESRVPTATTPVSPVKNQGPAFRRLTERSAAARSSPTHPHPLFAMPELDQSSPTRGHPLFHVLDDSSPTHAHPLLRALDSSPTRGHPLFVVPDDSSPTHAHSLFGLPPNGNSSPTVPRASARVMRRSSLFMSTHDDDEEQEHDTGHHPQALSATTEGSEPSSAEPEGSFEKDAHPGAAITEGLTEA